MGRRTYLVQHAAIPYSRGLVEDSILERIGLITRLPLVCKTLARVQKQKVESGKQNRSQRVFSGIGKGSSNDSPRQYMASSTANPLHKAMSYPGLLPDSDPKKDYVTFSIPNHKVIRKIIRNSEDHEHLRLQISGKASGKLLDEIALLFATCEIESSPIRGRQELRVRLFVPKPPAPPKPRPVLPAERNVGILHESRNNPALSMAPNYVVHEPSRFGTEVERKTNVAAATTRKHERRACYVGYEYIDQAGRRRSKCRWGLYTIEESLLEG